MPLKMSKAVVDANIRSKVFEILNIDALSDFHRINDRQRGTLIKDEEGNQRYVRVSVIVAELRDDMTAEELMQSEIDKYNATQEKKAAKAAERAEKAAKDKAKREAAKKEKEGD